MNDEASKILRQARFARGWNENTMADEVGCSHITIAKIEMTEKKREERFATPYIELNTIKRYARLLRINIVLNNR